MRSYFLIILFFFSTSFSAYSQADTSKINPYRLGIVLASGASVLVGSYIYVQNSWWSDQSTSCLLYTSPSPRDRLLSRMPSSA